MNNSKRRGRARGGGGVDPARRQHVEKALFARQSHRGQRSGTSTPPESPSASQSPPRGCVSRMGADTTTLATTTSIPRVARTGNRRARGTEDRSHCAPTGGASQGAQATPLTMEELSKGMLTEEAIRKAAGGVTKQQLQFVTRLALAIDSSQVSVDGVFDLVPNLHTLVLDGSRLLSFRDLGVGLRHLNTLSLESSRVEHLDGIGALSGLRELRLTCNRVSDVTPLACHGSLQVLGLQQNRVYDMNALEILSSIPLLYSLDLSRNPLMESLGKLRDGKGRAVVRQLIPQIRILDGTHLSSAEGATVSDQILDEAADLICHETSRFHAARAMKEDAEAAALATASAVDSTEIASGDRWRLKGESGGGGGGGESSECSVLAGSSESPLRIPMRSTVPSTAAAAAAVVAATGVQVGGRRSPSAPTVPDQGGIMHWDSDLTQGGRQALFGNPSSAIRRHKWEKGDGTGRRGQSPTRVLETLDLAKTMERSFKQRHSTQQSANRVSEWRRETCSDSVPQENSPYVQLDKNVLHSRHQARPLPSSVLENDFHHQRRPETSRGEQETAALDTGTAKETATWASLSTSGARALHAAQADNDVKLMTPAGIEGEQIITGRPWTTGGFGRGSRPATSARARVAVEAHGTRRAEGKEGAAVVVGNDDDGSERGHGARLNPHRRRPQTAREPGKRRGFPDSDDRDTIKNESRRASWKPVWESLQTAQLICTPRIADTATTTTTTNMAQKGRGGEKKKSESAGNSLSQPGEEVHRKTRSVDFGRQRRARTTARAVQGGRRDFFLESDGSHSVPDEETRSSGGDDSDEVGDRSRIKKRASDIGASDKTDSRACVVSRPPASDASPSLALSPCSSSTMRGEVLREKNSAHEHTRDVRPDEAGNTPSGKIKISLSRTRIRETASLIARRSLAVMDADSSSNSGSNSSSSSGSSDDEEVRILRTCKSAGRGGGTVHQSAVRTEKGVRGDRGSVSGGGGGGESDSERSGWKSSQRRISSTRASRMLGFDLRKSLEAIDEWTDKVPTATKTDSSSGGGTPRQGEKRAGDGHMPVSFIVEHFPDSSTLPVPTSFFAPYNSARRKEETVSPESSTMADGNVPGKRQSATMSIDRGSGAGARGSTVPVTTNRGENSGDDGIGGVSGDDDDGEAVLSVAHARAALGISKGAAPAARAITETNPPFSRARATPSAAEIDAIDAIAAEGRRGFELADSTAAARMTSPVDNRPAILKNNSSSRSRGQHMDDSVGQTTKGIRHGRSRAIRGPKRASVEATASTRAACPPGIAVGMSDEDLKGMLQKQPRLVSELRTKESFREFFQGMEAERMGRLLRGAYEGSVPADQVDKKIKKRLGLVGDILAWGSI